jgi:acyl transferase domain-containing protein
MQPNVESGYRIMQVSAKTDSALPTLAKQLAKHLKAHLELKCEDVLFTLQEGRHLFSHRLLLVCRNLDEAAQTLNSMDPKKVFTSNQEKQDSKPVFMFSGQGSQYIDMGQELYQQESVFKRTVDRCAEILIPLVHQDIRKLIFPTAVDAEAAAVQLQQTSITQPVLFVLEYALAKLWMYYGVDPESMIGHSIGEYTAACLAGVFSMQDALVVVAKRGQLMQGLTAGSMLSVPVSEAQAKTYLQEGLWLATVNAPNSCVISGTHEAIACLEERLQAEDIKCKRLRTSHAFHSGMMDSILEEFTQLLAGMTLQSPSIPMISNVTHDWLTDEEAISPAYWAKHLRSTVHFSGGIQKLLSDPKRVFIEIGPGNTLSTLTRRQDGTQNTGITTSLPHPNEVQPDQLFFITNLGRAWLSGVEINWNLVNRTQAGRRVELPTYPFERRRYWIEAKKSGTDDASGLDKKPDIKDWYYVPSWKQTVLSPEAVSQEEHAIWMLFKDELGVSDELAVFLQQHKKQVIVVEAAETYVQVNPLHFKIIPDQKESYESMFNALAQSKHVPQVIVHAWHLTGKTSKQGIAYYEEMQATGFYSLVALTQVIGTLDQPMQIAVVTNYLANVQGQERMEPEKATILGPVKVIPLEHAQLSCAGIDLLVSEAVGYEVAVEQIINEIEHNLPDRIVAYRGIRRWTQGYDAVPMASEPESQGMFKAEHTYIITGGMGGLGLVQAELIAQKVPANLVLLGRTALPPREQWEKLCEERSAEDRDAQKIRKIIALEKQGSNVLPLAADVTKESSLRSAIQAAKKMFGEIHGVIHSAGTPGGGLMQLKTREMADKVLLPKVKGVLLIQELLKDEPLEVLILNSSLFAITGGFGQVDYCAANNFLDCFAQSSYLPYLRVSLNWDAWEEIGMAVNASQGAASSSSAEPLLRASTHPLLDGVVKESAEEIVFQITLGVKEHWILEEHRLNKQPVIPGTAYLEMVRAALVELGQTSGVVELSDVFFMQPAQIPEGTSKLVQVRLSKQKAVYDFVVVSKNPATSEWDTHVMGKVGWQQPKKSEALDLEKTKQEYSAKILESNGSALDFLSEKDKTFLAFGPRWNSMHTMHIGKTSGLYSLELPAAFQTDLEKMLLHPALLDMGTGPSNGVLLAHMNEQGLLNTENQLYLPLSYKRITVLKPLTAKCFSHSRCRWEKEQDQETLHFDITLLDENGNGLVEIEDFALKRVPENVLKSLAPQPAGKEKGNEYLDILFSDSEKTEGIYPEEGKAAFARLLGWTELPQVAVCTSDLNYRIDKIRNMNEYSEQEAEGANQVKHPRPNLQTMYVDPETELEEKLAALWQTVLGIEKVGIHDNFFELGADSVLGIQYVSRAKAQGMVMAINQLFETPTIAELAKNLIAGGAGSGAVSSEAQEKELEEFKEDISDTDMDALMGSLNV